MPTNGYESGKTNGVICRLRVGPASSRTCDRYAGSSANGIPQRTVSLGSEVSQPSRDDSPCARISLQPEGFVTSSPVGRLDNVNARKVASRIFHYRVRSDGPDCGHV